jgi:regulator of protease activity HflC (stomatin/prohibitin superfamily)
LLRQKKEAERKEIEARGIAEFQKIVNRTITPQLLKWKGVEATQEISKSPNSKVIVIGNGDGDLPIILGGQ